MIGIIFLAAILITGILCFFIKQKTAGIVIILVVAILCGIVYLNRNLFTTDVNLDVKTEEQPLEAILDNIYAKEGNKLYYVKIAGTLQGFQKTETEVKNSDTNTLKKQTVSFIKIKKNDSIGNLFGDIFASDKIKTKMQYIIETKK